MAHPVLASMGVDSATMASQALWVAVFVAQPGALLEFARYRFFEARPDLGSVSAFQYPDRTPLDPPVQNLRVAWSSTPRESEIWSWHVWTQGDSARAWYRPDSPMPSIPAGGEISAQPGPPLSDGHGVCDAFLVVKPSALPTDPFTDLGRREIVGVIFDASAQDQPPTAREGFRLGLAREPAFCVAAQRLVNETRAVRLTVGDHVADGSARVTIYEVVRDAPPRPLAVVDLDQRVFLPSTEPAFRINADGSMAVSFLVREDQALRKVRVVDITISAQDDAKPQILEGDATDLPAEPVAGVVGFQSRPDRPMSRHWALRLGDGTIAHNVSRNLVFRPQGEPVMPLQIAVMSQTTYLLTLDGNKPMLEGLR